MVDAVMQPDDAGARGLGILEQRFECLCRLQARGRKGLRRNRGRRRARLDRWFDSGRDHLGRWCRRQQHDGAALAFGLRDQPVDHAETDRPAGCCRPVVVDGDDEGPRTLERRFLGRIEHRLGQCENDQGGGKQAQQRQPPGCLVRRFLLVFQADQDARRRKLDLRRTRRHGAQQPINDGQRRECGKKPGIEKGEGAEGHGFDASVSPVPFQRKAAPEPPRWAIKARSGSAGGRSV